MVTRCHYFIAEHIGEWLGEELIVILTSPFLVYEDIFIPRAVKALPTNTICLEDNAPPRKYVLLVRPAPLVPVALCISPWRRMCPIIENSIDYFLVPNRKDFLMHLS
jgi:hypothetical protein